jgi:hypothetical protein
VVTLWLPKTPRTPRCCNQGSSCQTREDFENKIDASVAWRQRYCLEDINTLYLKCLLSGYKCFPEPDAKYRHHLTVQLQPFKKKLLDDACREYLEPEDVGPANLTGPLDQLACFIFFRWSWASDVLRYILAELGPRILLKIHEGSSEPFLSRVKKVPVKTVELGNAGHYPMEEPGLQQMSDAIIAFPKSV